MASFQNRRRRQPKGDPVNGMLLLDKPSGVTSNGALQRVKSLMNAQKAGHTGSLDPIATGLLPLCFGEATKVSSFFLNADKSYWTRVHLGAITTTGDREGEIIEQRPVSASQDSIEAAMREFRGVIQQTPPMFSAIKRNGQPLYKLARQGIEVERKPREVEVYDLRLTGMELPYIDLEISCSRGFYVRSLATDLGEALGCGGHVEDLRRTAVGTMELSSAVTIDHLEELETAQERRKFLVPADEGLAHLPRIDLSVDATFYLVRGQSVRAGHLPSEGWVRIYSSDTGFLGLGEVTDDGKVAPKRLFKSSQPATQAPIQGI
jgi:tRNA pseudouridine55 synthase